MMPSAPPPRGHRRTVEWRATPDHLVCPLDAAPVTLAPLDDEPRCARCGRPDARARVQTPSGAFEWTCVGCSAAPLPV
jgi:hypothetical protein